jgi:hypothetical protein
MELPLIPSDDLLIERNIHLCNLVPQFCDAFKMLFKEGDQTLLSNQNLNFKITDELDIE